jgi:hypothetical protein
MAAAVLPSICNKARLQHNAHPDPSTLENTEMNVLTPVLHTVPFTAEQTAQFQSDFNRDGFLHIPGVLSPDEVAALKEGVDNVFSDSHWEHNGNVYSDFIAVRMFETGSIFEQMLAREPVISLLESLLGNNCHIIAQNAMRNAPGQAVDTFHVDEELIWPVGEGMERHDSRYIMPVLLINVMFPLTPIPSVEYGPTQCVPGSHYAGRAPNDLYAPNFERQEPVSILCEPGDMYLFNTQVWHRGAPNLSDQTRYIFGMAFGRRFMAQRFYPFMNYQMPEHVVANASDRSKRLLGFHAKGPYG